MCLKNGIYEEVRTWPKCDAKKLPMCTDFPQPADNVPIGIIKAEPQLPGGSIYYRCKKGGQISTLGFEIEVSAN